jgi:hypothetical protein
MTLKQPLAGPGRDGAEVAQASVRVWSADERVRSRGQAISSSALTLSATALVERTGGSLMTLSGTEVRNENVLLLASMFDGDVLGEKLERAVTNNNSIVALSVDDRERIVDVLTANAPSGLSQLRDVLGVQLKRYKDREAHQQRMRLNEDRARRRKHVAGA